MVLSKFLKFAWENDPPRRTVADRLFGGLFKGKKKDVDKLAKYMVNVLTISDDPVSNVLNEDIKYAKEAVATSKEMFNDFSKWYSVEDNEIKKNNWLDDYHIKWWIKFLILLYQNGRTTAYANANYFVQEEGDVKPENVIENMTDDSNLLLMPVNVGQNHWCLFFYIKGMQKLCYYNPRGRSKKIQDNLKEKALRLARFFDPTANISTTDVIQPVLPQRYLQNDDINCALFVIFLIKALIRNAEPSENEFSNIQEQRTRLIAISEFIKQNHEFPVETFFNQENYAPASTNILHNLTQNNSNLNSVVTKPTTSTVNKNANNTVASRLFFGKGLSPKSNTLNQNLKISAIVSNKFTNSTTTNKKDTPLPTITQTATTSSQSQTVQIDDTTPYQPISEIEQIIRECNTVSITSTSHVGENAVFAYCKMAVLSLPNANNYAIMDPQGFRVAPSNRNPRSWLFNFTSTTTKIFIPLCDARHWYLFLFNVDQKRFFYYEPYGNARIHQTLYEKVHSSICMLFNFRRRDISIVAVVIPFTMRQRDSINCAIFTCDYTLADMKGISLSSIVNYNITQRRERFINIINTMKNTRILPTEFFLNDDFNIHNPGRQSGLQPLQQKSISGVQPLQQKSIKEKKSLSLAAIERNAKKAAMTEQQKELHLEKDRARKQAKNQNMTPVQRDAYNKKQQQYGAKKLSQMTPVQRDAYNKQQQQIMSQRKSQMTPAERDVYNKKQQEIMAQRLSQMTPAERDVYNKQQQEIMAQRLSQMTPAERDVYNKKQQEIMAQRLSQMTPAERDVYNKQQQEIMAQRLSQMTPDEREAYNKQQQEIMAQRLSQMTPDEREAYNKQQQEIMAQRLSQMTPDEREAYNKQQQEIMAQRLSQMGTEEKNKQILQKKERDQKRRSNMTDEAKKREAIRKRMSYNKSMETMRNRQQIHRVQRILHLFGDIKNTDSVNELKRLNLLSTKQYEKLRKNYERLSHSKVIHPSLARKYRKIKSLQRDYKKMTEISRIAADLVQNMDTKVITQKLKNFGDLGILLKLRQDRPPACEEEELTQIHRVKLMSGKLDAMIELAFNSITNIQQKITKQVTAEVKRADHETPGNYLIRQIGRGAYHVLQPKEDPTGYGPADENYPLVFEKMMASDADGFEAQHGTIEDQNEVILRDDIANEVILETDVSEKDDCDNNVEAFVKSDDEEDLVHITNKISEQKNPAMTNEIDKVIFEEVLYDDEVRENAGPIGHIPFRSITMIKACCNDCPKFTEMMAQTIQNEFLTLASINNENREKWIKLLMQGIENLTTKQNPLIQMTTSDALNQFFPCRGGIRSISRRFSELKLLVFFIDKIYSAYKNFDYQTLYDTVQFIGVPRAITNEISSRYFDSVDDLTEEWARKKFGNHLNAFKKQIQNNEVDPCDICHQLNLPSNVQTYEYNPSFFNEFMTKTQIEAFSKNKTIDVCKNCIKSMKKNELPAACVANGLDLDPMYPFKEPLNWLEKTLVQINRPIQTTFNLKNISGKPTKVHGKKGALVILPVPTEETINHLVNVLPSTDNLTIIVNTSVGQPLVRLPLVLAYLKHLKETNRYYKDIVINENFSFDKDKNLIFDKPPTEEQIKSLITHNNDDPHLLTQAEFRVQPVIDTDDNAPDGTGYEQFNLLRNPFNPIKMNAEGIDVKSFPDLFPTGNYGFDHERTKRITRRQYVRHRLRNKDRRFATNAKYLCMMQGIFENTDIASSVAIQSKIAKSKLNAKAFKEALEEDDEKLQQCMSSQFAALRGHTSYWNKVKNKLKAHISMFGSPTWFLTLNPSEEDWAELLEAYKAIYKEENVTKENIRDFVAKDPYIWCRHFQKRVKAFFKNVLLKDDGPLGKIIHHFYRIEYQSRGTEHVHCLLWSADAPKADDTEAEIIKYIDQHVTARIPDPVKEPELYNYVIKLQQHFKSHSKTCRRVISNRGQRITQCRFEFPRPATSITKINRSANAGLNYVGGKTKFYSLKRQPGEEQWTNDYNPAILLGWKGNTDLQFLSQDLLHIVNYVTGYATKGESSKKESLFDNLNNTTISTADRFRIYHDFLKKREMGVMELVDMLMGHHMFEFDCGHVFINSNKSEKRFRILLPKAQIEKLADGQQAFQPNWWDHYYSNRPKNFENSSLFNMLSNFKITNSSKRKAPDEEQPDEMSEPDQNSDNDNQEDDLFDETLPENIKSATKNPFKDSYNINDNFSPFFCHPNYTNGSKFPLLSMQGKSIVKQKPLIPQIYWPKLEVNNEESREDYFRRLCFLFIPWRIEEEIMNGFESYEDRWIDFMENLKQKSENAFADIERVIFNQTKQLAMEEEIYEARKKLRQAMKANFIDDEPEDELEMFDRQVDTEKHEAAKTGLNGDQEKIMKFVFDELTKQDEGDPEAKPFFVFVSGTAGTGKSFLIETITNEAFIRYSNKSTSATRPPACVCAPTGLASIQINGSTIHSLFKINVQNGKEKTLASLSPEALNLRRMLFKNVRLLIIDEISMVSNELLAKIHYRLTQFKGNNELFGGVNLLAFGDLLQLPPVRAQPVFTPLTLNQINKIFNSSVANFSFWELFEYRELLENMRQKKSLEFAELLGRMRVQALTEEDHTLLRSRVIPGTNGGIASMQQLAEKYIEIQESDPNIMALFSTQDEVTTFNTVVLKKLKLKAVEIEADDSDVKTKSNSKRTRIYQTKQYSVLAPVIPRKPKSSRLTAKDVSKYDTNDQRLTAGLAKKLTLAVGCRIMLRRNVNASIGLVNGATGILEEIVSVNNVPTHLRIKFDNITEVQTISKVSAVFNVGAEQQCCRHQFPVSMSFAATIHKCQGLTLKNAIVSFETIFAAGQAFVACSRVTTIEGLHLADYNPSKIYVHAASLQEYNRLRSTINLPPYTVIKKTTVQQPKESVAKITGKRKINEVKGKVLIVTPKPKKAKKTINDSPAMSQDPVIYDTEGQPLMQIITLDSYILSAINFLQRLNPIALNLQENVQMDPILVELALIYINPHININKFKTQLLQHHQIVDQSPVNVIANIMQHLDEELKVSFQIKYTKTSRCCCPAKFVHESVYSIDFSLNNLEKFPLNPVAKDNKMTFDNFFSTFTTLVETCPVCQQQKVDKLHLQHQIGNPLNYIILTIDGYMQNAKGILKKRPFVVSGLTDVTMFQRQWTLIAAVEKKPTNDTYVTWVKTLNGWKTISGDTIENKPTFTTCISNYCLLLYKYKPLTPP